MISSTKSARFSQALDITLRGIDDSLCQYMPNGPAQDYMRWSISPKNPQRDAFLMMTGVLQLVNLTVKLPDGLLDDVGWQRLIRSCSAINSFFSFEIISDNLAFGLAVKDSADTDNQLRRELLVDFNRVMMKALNGCSDPAVNLLTGLSQFPVRLFANSLTQKAQKKLAADYLLRHPDLAVDDLDVVWPYLVANVETGRAMLRNVTSPELGALVQTGLRRRYSAMNVLLEQRELTRNERIWVGAYTILVVPTLAYYTAILGEQVENQTAFKALLQENRLKKIFFQAAQLVRMTNDLGTDLMKMNEEAREAFFHGLLTEAVQTPYYHLNSFIQAKLPSYPQLARLAKDATMGEFNIALYGMDPHLPVDHAVDALQHEISVFARIYQKTEAALQTNLDDISQKMDDDRIATLVSRFVRFHELLYSCKGEAEYTLAPEEMK